MSNIICTFAPNTKWIAICIAYCYPIIWIEKIFINQQQKLLLKKMKENKNMKVYVTPMVEVMNARVEKGFQISTTSPLEPVTPNGIVMNESDFD